MDLQNHELFKHNKEFDDYCNLINNSEKVAFNSNERREGFEKHHIIPRHYFKHKGIKTDDSADNCVWLSKQDHKYAHSLLFKCVVEDYRKGELMCKIIGSQKNTLKAEILNKILNKNIIDFATLMLEITELELFDDNFIFLCEETMRFNAMEKLLSEIINGYNPFEKYGIKIIKE